MRHRQNQPPTATMIPPMRNLDARLRIGAERAPTGGLGADGRPRGNGFSTAATRVTNESVVSSQTATPVPPNDSRPRAAETAGLRQ